MIPLRVKWYNPSPHSRRISPGDAARVRELSGQGYLPSAIAFELPHRCSSSRRTIYKGADPAGHCCKTTTQNSYQKLGDWRPAFNDIQALYLAHGSDWKSTPVGNAEELCRRSCSRRCSRSRRRSRSRRCSSSRRCSRSRDKLIWVRYRILEGGDIETEFLEVQECA